MQIESPEEWQCADNAPAPNVEDWCYLEDDHEGAHSWARGIANNPIVEYSLYLHGSKDSAYEAARSAGITADELNGKLADLMYVGYELEIKVTVNRETGEVKTVPANA